jgi:integrase
MKMILPNGCAHSELSVKPNDWHTKKAKVTTNWFIKYRFYDPNKPLPKQVMIKGMNSFKTLKERQTETMRLLNQEMELLTNGYNPFNKQIDLYKPYNTLIEALNMALANISVADITKRDIKAALSKFNTAIELLNWCHLPINEVSRKHFREILDRSSNTDDRFNKHRSYLMILVSALCEMEIVPNNYIRDIKKRKTTKFIRQVLTQDERVLVNEYLENNFPSFHRFLHIFFHSGARIAEIMRMKVIDVDLPNQRYKVVIKKGGSYYEVWKTIKTIALPYWTDQLKAANPSEFVFSKGLESGDQQIQPYQINKRWYRLVKKKFGITADFYSLKHLHTSEVVELLSDIEAAKHNSHKTTTMVNTVYDVNKSKRKEMRIIELGNGFA